MSWSSFDSRASPFLTCWRILAYQDPLCQMVHSPWSNLDKTMGSSCTVRKSLVLLKAQQQISAFQGCETEESYSLIRFLVCFFVVVVFLSLAALAKLVASSYLLTREESARVSLQPARERDTLRACAGWTRATREKKSSSKLMGFLSVLRYLKLPRPEKYIPEKTLL